MLFSDGYDWFDEANIKIVLEAEYEARPITGTSE